MAIEIKITQEGVTIHLDTADEFKFVPIGSSATDAKVKPTRKSIKVATDVPLTLSQFIRALPKNTNYSRILSALLNRPEGMKDEELKRELSLKGGPALGGALGGLSKRAVRSKSGITLKDIIAIKTTFVNGLPSHHYKITDKAREVMQSK